MHQNPRMPVVFTQISIQILLFLKILKDFYFQSTLTHPGVTKLYGHHYGKFYKKLTQLPKIPKWYNTLEKLATKNICVLFLNKKQIDMKNVE